MVALFLRQEAVDQRRAWFPRDCLAIASVDVGRRADVLHCTACCVVPCPTGRFRRFGNAPKGERPRVRSWKQRERHQEPRERGRSAHRGIRHACDATRTSRDPKSLSNLPHVDPNVIRRRGRGIGPRFVIDTFPRRYRRSGRDFDIRIDFSLQRGKNRNTYVQRVWFVWMAGASTCSGKLGRASAQACPRAPSDPFAAMWTRRDALVRTQPSDKRPPRRWISSRSLAFVEAAGRSHFFPIKPFVCNRNGFS